MFTIVYPDYLDEGDIFIESEVYPTKAAAEKALFENRASVNELLIVEIVPVGRYQRETTVNEVPL